MHTPFALKMYQCGACLIRFGLLLLCLLYCSGGADDNKEFCKDYLPLRTQGVVSCSAVLPEKFDKLQEGQTLW